MEELTAVKHLEVGNIVEGNGSPSSEWAVLQCFRPFGEGATYHVEFQNVETGEKLYRYLPADRQFNVLR
jgi:translation elongation factor P/translation initiation factor 5A